MKKIVVKKVSMMNFKKFTEKTIEFGDNVTSIFGQNYRGKSSVADAFSWTLFNKSSTGNTEGSQFRPRRYDVNGVNIDHVDVTVELELVVDGDDLKIRKTQRQKWVRHHGDDFESYMGDETIYEWNDVPVTATQHKQKVEGIISEDVFRMLSNPSAFPSLPAKKQREFLLEHIANITDADVFATSPEFEPVRAAMGKKTLDELIAKTKREITGYKKKQEELPTRIDQESKHIENIDFSKEEKLLAKLESDLDDAYARLEDTSKSYEKVSELRAEKRKCELDKQMIEERTKDRFEAEKRRVYKIVSDASEHFKELQEKHSKVESALKIHRITVESKNEELNKLRTEYMTELKKELVDGDFFCHTCGQYMPEHMREEIESNFEENKRMIIKSINEKGQIISEELIKLETEIDEYLKTIEELKQEKIQTMSLENKNRAILKKLEESVPDLCSDEEWEEYHDRLLALQSRIERIDTSNSDAIREKIREEIKTIKKSMDEVKERLALKSVIEKSKAAVEELKEEMAAVNQNLANCERLEKMIEKFNKAKMDMLSERINGKFKLVKWKLFEKQKNQKFAEVCVCMVNGSCYGDNTTSATERMLAGMDIIRTLHEIYGISAPIFLDDADLYNEWNIPEMDCQLIKLCVSEDEELRVGRG